MTKKRASANREEAPKSHRDYEFGTFGERLEHLCVLFEIDPPKIVYEDGQPTLTDEFTDWIGEHELNMDWLFGGSPCVMLRDWTKQHKSERKFLDVTNKLEPEVVTGLITLMRATVIHGIPMEEAEKAFSQVVNEFRDTKAA